MIILPGHDVEVEAGIMSAWRCPNCQINYPYNMMHVKCAACGTFNVLDEKVGEHEDWAARVEKRQDELKKVEEAADQSIEEGESWGGFEKVIGWRFSELVKAGYDPRTAKKMAAKHMGLEKVDLEEARQMVAAGCTPDMAADILL